MKNVKKWSFLILAALMLSIGASAASPQVTVFVPEKEELVDGMYVITVSISNNPGFSAAQIELSYDSGVLQCQSVIPGEVLRGMFTDTNPLSMKGTSSALLSAAGSRNNTDSGTLASFVFSAPQQGDPGFALVTLVLTDVSGRQLTLHIDLQNNYGASGEASGDTQTPTLPGGSESGDDATGEDTAEDNTSESPLPETTTPPLAAAPRFDDVPDTHWAKAFIESAAARGLVSGDGSGCFYPDRGMTRAEFVTLLWNNAGRPQAAAAPEMRDVTKTDWFYAAVAWGLESGCMRGVGENTFSPNDLITREQAMTILHRLVGSPAPRGGLNGFADSGTVSAYAQEAMCWAVENGIITGLDNGTLAPQQTATRAQVVTILVRYLA